jgi:SOS regulatory protein LexA
MKLNVEQRKIVELEPTGHMSVKGVAGSGKTSVAIRRLSFLQEHYCFEPDDKILLVTYNKTLLNFIKYQFNQLEEEAEYTSFLREHAADITITTIDKLMFHYFKKRSTRLNLALKPLTNRRQLLKILNQAIYEMKDRFKDVSILSPKYQNFLLEEIQWIKACDINDVEVYQDIDRIGRATGSKGMPQKLTKNSDTRAAIFTLKNHYDKLMVDHGFVDFPSLNLMALREVEEHQAELFTHIIIDESQDLTKVQLMFISRIQNDKPHQSLMFIADNTQSIYNLSWLGKGRPYTTIGYDMSGRSRTLSKNYRTTTEISKAAYGLIEHDEAIMGNVDFVKPALIDRHGHAPIYRFFKDHASHLQFLKHEINQLRGDYNYKDICIVAKEKRFLEDIERYLSDEGIPIHQLKVQTPDFEKDAVKCLTMHSIKGLEFKVIMLVDLDAGVIPNFKYTDIGDEETVKTEERKLFYVGMTRANDLLYMTSVKQPSELLKEINPEHLRMYRDQKLRPYRTIAMKDYRLTDQVSDINSKEEKVRQWMISELIDRYRYPDLLLELEYPVQQFSKQGYVDIAVKINHNGVEKPYIFVETKAPGAGIEDGLNQLKTYLGANKDVKYGVVTDGLELVVLDRHGEVVSDIPSCQPQFYPDEENHYVYHNFRQHRYYDVLENKDDKEIVSVVDQATKLTLKEPLVKIPIVGDVAAGLPISAIEYYSDTCLLPESFIIRAGETFALTVKGDSMINAGIDPGDTVIVHRQATAETGDIVIAVIDDEATMKRYNPMGSQVILQSENHAYEPILMDSADVKINGKVIGVLKGK